MRRVHSARATSDGVPKQGRGQVKQIKLVSGVLTVGFWTLMSRIFGFIRDILIAAWLGTGPVAEAFMIAFALPNMFRRFFAEGAFNMAFVPMFSKKLEAGDDANSFARDAFAGLSALLVIFTVLECPESMGTQDEEKLHREMNRLLKVQLNPLFKISRIKVVESLPRTASNKVMRRKLRDELAN